LHFSASLFGFALGCLVALALTPLAGRLGRRPEFTDQPTPRKLHLKEHPQLGGLALLGAFALSFLGILIAFPDARGVTAGFARALLPSAALVAVSGLIDDLQPKSPWKKLSIQLLAVALLQLQLDVLGLGRSGMVADLTVWLGAGMALLWILGLSNAMNLIDGIDGLAAGISIISGVGLLSLAWAVGESSVAIASAILIGSAFGFLRSNIHPAKIFMGDMGSLFLGFVLAVLGTTIYWSRPALTTLAALVLVAWIPLMDVLYAIVRRMRAKRSIFSPDVSHLHHRLLRVGLSHRMAALLLCGIGSITAAAGVGIVRDRHPWAWALAVLVATLPLAWALAGRSARSVATRWKDSEKQPVGPQA
jgi:UDP-GlcNAc:undecaprenyl-phosphate GlcNAc-1-phosphate transferase